MHEVETKILNVDAKSIAVTMQKIGAEKVLETRLIVGWYGPRGLTHNGDDPWFLRIRTYSGERHEVTWKGKSDILGTSRKHKEINFTVSDPVSLGDLFEELDLEKYGHQEKDRVSWIYKDWRFDLDQYPEMPAYLEIEGKDEAHIQEAIQLLGLQDHKTSSEGERVLIQKEYGLDWFKMNF
ncbi:CYTH domain-containing protein [Candidatus Uhrbacteria bacterium]|nr:CYTH domain-containing protein [Candidatus Uhrbacteria bacterium]